jgi:alkylation response protein AidB-like acyl-CoA dehydrogenase
LLTHAALALAAEGIGGSEAVLALTIVYLEGRQQFGKPLASFQALKHRVADHRVRIVAGRQLLQAAMAMAAAGEDLAASEASAAKAMICANYADCARDCIQLHGGMGFTAEQPAHLFLKRALLNETLYGDRALHLKRAADHVLRGAAA